MAASGKTAGATSAAPTRKVLSAGLAGALGTILVYFYNTYAAPAAPLPADVAAAVTTLLSIVVAYLTPPADDEAVVATAQAPAAA